MSKYADCTAYGTGQDSWQGDKADVRHAQEDSCDWAHHNMERDKGPLDLLECQVEYTALKQCPQQALERGKDAGVLLAGSSLKQQAASRSFLHSLQGRLLQVCHRLSGRIL